MTTFQHRLEAIYRLTGDHQVVGWEFFAGPGRQIAPHGAAAYFRDHPRPDILDCQLLGVAARLRQHHVHQFITVNLTPATLISDHFWEKAELRWDGVVLELSETGPLPRDPVTLSRISDWRARGGKLAFDDLGAGHSRLVELAIYRPEYVKLDVDLTHAVTTYPASAAARMVAELARTETEVIAEGVLDAAEAETLAGIGVRYGQSHTYPLRTVSTVQK
ncbi:MAG TPA: EAL domain-containing protein [Acidimicrobiia bacterium]|nr:EAL domain-containing protein [Acidimicrobiia bacterium]